MNKRGRAAMDKRMGDASASSSLVDAGASAEDPAGRVASSSSAGGELTSKDVGYCGHGPDVFKSLARERFRIIVKADLPKANANDVDKRVLAMATAEFKKLPATPVPVGPCAQDRSSEFGVHWQVRIQQA